MLTEKNKLTVMLSSALLLLMLVVTNSVYAQGETSLEQAFQKEFAFLEAQKQQLNARLIKQKKTAEKEISRLRSEVDAEEQRLLGLESASDRINDLLLESERAIELNIANRDTLSATFDQSESALTDYGYTLNDDQAYAAGNEVTQLERIYQQATYAMEKLASIRTEPGSFYRQDGAKVDGQIIKIGDIASYASSAQGSGILVPAGGGAMKLWSTGDDASDQQTALALLKGEVPKQLRLFLYESRNTAVSEKRADSILDTIDSGGIIGWVIVSLGGLAVLLILLRALFLRAASASTGALLGPVGALIREGKHDDALALCKNSRGSTARVLADTVRNLDRDRDHLEDIISESILHESTTLNRFGSFIMVIAAVSPLLGLLGTVTGMIATFDVITEFGTGDPKLLSGGISTALVTTELGLVIAIPALIFGNLLSGWSNRIKDEMEKAALHITNLSQVVNLKPLPAISAAA